MTVLSKLSVKRLTILSDFMGKVKLRKGLVFDMRDIYYKNECGTTMCALGFATMIPEFKKAGLLIEEEGCEGACGEVVYKDAQISELAAEKFFKITGDQVDHLFFDNFDIKTPKAWAKYCRRFIDKNSPRETS